MKVHYGNYSREQDYDYNARKKRNRMRWTAFSIS